VLILERIDAFPVTGIGAKAFVHKQLTRLGYP
jgi:hypothetical protein